MAVTRRQSNAEAIRQSEATREVIKELAEMPPVKTMAEVKAASEVFEAAAQSGEPRSSRGRHKRHV